MIVTPPNSPPSGARPRPEPSPDSSPRDGRGATFAEMLEGGGKDAVVELPVAGIADPMAEAGGGGSDLAAEVFNARGFFGTATASDPTSGPQAAEEVPSPCSPEPADSRAGFEAAADWNAALPARLDRRPAPAAPVPRSAPVSPLRVAMRDVGPAAGGAPPMRPSVRPPAARPETPSTSPASRAASRPAPARTSPFAVALRPGEEGLGVTVRLDGIDEAERATLRDEIAALLSRHGLSASHITIAAPVPPRGHRGDDAR